jgi:hypothetical protein
VRGPDTVRREDGRTAVWIVLFLARTSVFDVLQFNQWAIHAARQEAVGDCLDGRNHGRFGGQVITARRLELALVVIIGAAIVLLGVNLFLAQAHDRLNRSIQYMAVCIDGDTRWMSRADGICYEADRPK